MILTDKDILPFTQWSGWEIGKVPLKFLEWICKKHDEQVFDPLYDDFNDALIDYVEKRKTN